MAVTFLDTVTVDGNVGIGITSPTEKLHVKTSGVEIAKYETTATADLAIELANSQGSMFFGLGGGEQFAVGTDSDLNGSNNLFIIEQGGNTGIGTNSPSAKLHVSGGDLRLDNNEQLQFGSSSVKINSDASNRMYLKANFEYLFEGNGGYKMTLNGTSGNLDVTGTVSAPTVRATGGGDGGFVLREWTQSSSYASLTTNNMTGLEYCMISDGTNTLVGGGSGGSLKLRGPANDSSPQIVIDGSSVTVDDGASVGQGSIRAKYKSSDNTAGQTSTFTVRNGNNSASLTFVIKDGIVTSVTSSDRRLKKNIKLIGKSASGINIYEFQYKAKYAQNYGTGKFQGVMSDEVPWRAVSIDKGGYDMVDYSMIDVEFKAIA